jgi:hypothetical protein
MGEPVRDTASRGALNDGSAPSRLVLQDEVDRLRLSNQAGQSGCEPQGRAGRVKEEPRVIDLRENPLHKPERLTRAELENLQYLQGELLSLRKCQLHQEAEKNKAEGKPADSPAIILERLKKLETSLKQEYESGEYGINTRQLYGRMVAWIENQAIPDSLSNGVRYGVSSRLKLPPCSIRYGEERSSVWDLGLDTSIDKELLPSEADLNKLEAVSNWLTESAKSINTASLEQMMAQEIPNRGFPPGWLDRSGDNHEQKLQMCAERVGLAATAQYCLQAMDLLHRLGGKFPMDPPPGCDPASLERDKDGNVILEKIKLDLPDGLNPQSQSEKEKIDRLNSWVNKNIDLITQAEEQLKAACTGIAPPLSIREAQPEEGFGSVVVNADGKGKLSARTLPPGKDGEPATEGTRYNLTTNDYRVERDDKGNIKVTPTIQYWDVPFFSPHNVRKTAVTDPIDLSSRTYSPDAFVPVVRNGVLEMVQAKDLASIHDEDNKSQENSKTLRLVMDGVISAIMIGSGVGEAYGAAELLSARFGLGAIRTVAGLMGSIEGSAGANESSLVRNAMLARGVYFVGDSALHLHSLWKAWRAARGALSGAAEGADAAAEAGAEALSNAQKLANVIKAAGGLAIDLPMSYMIMSDFHRKRVNKALERHDPARGVLRSVDDMSHDNAVRLRAKQ